MFFGKIICWRPPGELAPPPTGNPGSAPGCNGISSKLLTTQQRVLTLPSQ